MAVPTVYSRLLAEFERSSPQVGYFYRYVRERVCVNVVCVCVCVCVYVCVCACA